MAEQSNSYNLKVTKSPLGNIIPGPDAGRVLVSATGNMTPWLKKDEEVLAYRVVTFLRRNFSNVTYRWDIAADLRVSMAKAVKLKSLYQHKRKWPDLFIAHPMQGKEKTYHGFYIELKATKRDVFQIRSGEIYKKEHLIGQQRTLLHLAQLGYAASFAWGTDDHVFHLIERYLTGENMVSTNHVGAYGHPTFAKIVP